eukprot:4277450-Prymnesium_polylepis.1
MGAPPSMQRSFFRVEGDEVARVVWLVDRHALHDLRPLREAAQRAQLHWRSTIRLDGSDARASNVCDE